MTFADGPRHDDEDTLVTEQKCLSLNAERIPVGFFVRAAGEGSAAKDGGSQVSCIRELGMGWGSG
jgi:hypothetical protein